MAEVSNIAALSMDHMLARELDPSVARRDSRLSE